MRRPLHPLLAALAVAALSLPSPLRATDVDGPDDCQRASQDFGDAPEGIQAYPGVLAMFPTCVAAGPIGVRNAACAPISTVPGPAGFVRHVNPAGIPPYWLGCGTAAPMGIDSENDGKTNDNGGPLSACNDLLVDCVEAAFGLNFGQDECNGSSDAGIQSVLSFAACSTGVVTFNTSNCATAPRTVYLNILLDMNEDGDWNDNFLCGTSCAYEWVVKNATLVLPPGCSTQSSPMFLVGPRANHGFGWLRLTISDGRVPDDFPWNGSAGTPNQGFQGGETEDYPVTFRDSIPNPCPEYDDFGDAPEEVNAYPGVIGHFPTCTFGAPAGGQEADCPPISSPPGAAAGYVKHVRAPGDPFAFWLGCSALAPSIDSEGDGKMNPVGLGPSVCAQAINVDCAEPAFGGVMTFGQDECYGDTDAGLTAAPVFSPCSGDTLTVYAYNCGLAPVDAYLNVLVDWNGDGDWNDNFQCGPVGGCAYEWGVQNQLVILQPGCTKLRPGLLTGPFAGNAWMRVTLTASPVPEDFPWAGSAGLAGGQFRGGETEDYPLTIESPDPCQAAFEDFGDAPEGIAAYSSGAAGHFPTCLGAAGPGTQTIDCGGALSTFPGPTGYVRHVTTATAVHRIWLGCGTTADPGLGRDSEPDGKVNINPPFGVRSACDTTVTVDCFEPAWLSFGQDECYGTPDACLASPMTFRSCSDTVLVLTAYNCGPDTVDANLNVLVDWNGDGDWNDVTKCARVNLCRPEWVAKNRFVRLAPGCNFLQVPIRAGSRVGEAWMRITLTFAPVPDDFPWNGSAGLPGGAFAGGETEDYPVRIAPSYVDVTPDAPRDLGFAPLTPNPSRTGVLARIALPREGEITLVAYDVTGRTVRVIARGWMPAGEQTLTWDFRDDRGRAVPAGLYLLKLRMGVQELTQRVIRLN